MNCETSPTLNIDELETKKAQIEAELEDAVRRIEVLEKELSDTEAVLRAFRIGGKITIRESI